MKSDFRLEVIACYNFTLRLKRRTSSSTVRAIEAFLFRRKPFPDSNK